MVVVMGLREVVAGDGLLSACDVGDGLSTDFEKNRIV